MNPTADIDSQAPTVWTNEEGAVWHIVWGPTHRRAIKAERNVTVSYTDNTTTKIVIMTIWMSRKLLSRCDSICEIMQEYFIKTSSNICFGYLLESPGDSNKYPKRMFCEEIRIKQGFFLHIILSINDSLQQQVHFNGNIFGNKCCRCNEGSLYHT